MPQSERIAAALAATAPPDGFAEKMAAALTSDEITELRAVLLQRTPEGKYVIGWRRAERMFLMLGITTGRDAFEGWRKRESGR